MKPESYENERLLRPLDVAEMTRVEGGHQDARLENGQVVLKNWDGSTRGTGLKVLPPVRR